MDYNPDDFVLIYQNTNVFDSIYRFIHVHEAYNCSPIKFCFRDAPIDKKTIYETPNPTGIYLGTTRGGVYGLNIGSPTNKSWGTKLDWVNKGVEHFLFDKTQKYLYCHKGSMGFYDFAKKQFVEFKDNHGVYTFFYRMMRLTDKPLNYMVSDINVVEKTGLPVYVTKEEIANREAELDAYSDDDDDEDSDEDYEES